MLQRRLVDADQQPAEWMLFFTADLAAERRVQQVALPLPPPIAPSEARQGQAQRRVQRDRQ
jgi:hypothetical protein